MTTHRSRHDQLAALYADHHKALERIVARQVNAHGTILEDACQTAWTSLCAHDDVAVDGRSALSWLVTTATREAWKRATRVTRREQAAGSFLPSIDDTGASELPEPAGESAEPCELAIAREEHDHRLTQLRGLTDRQRLYLYLQALGYSYTESAQLTAATTRTVERQIRKARTRLKDASQRGVKTHQSRL